MPDALPRNGWFVNTEGVVFAVINDSLYEADVEGTPLAKLPPGSYTKEEASAALAKLADKK